MKTSDDANVRWTIFAPKETDLSLRTHLAQAGVKKGGLSKFVADAVRWRLFDLNVAAAQARNQAVSSEQLEDEIEQALAEVRAERFAKRP
jgi:hypothetical protein